MSVLLVVVVARLAPLVDRMERPDLGVVATWLLLVLVESPVDRPPLGGRNPVSVEAPIELDILYMVAPVKSPKAFFTARPPPNGSGEDEAKALLLVLFFILLLEELLPVKPLNPCKEPALPRSFSSFED